MKEFFSVGEAAKAVRMTAETLRYYDRIGLVKPSRKDSWTNYRYYTQQDLVRLNTVRALQLMDLPLQEIKNVLSYDDLEKIVDLLERAEKKADEKIAALQYSKAKIQLAKSDYERKRKGQKSPGGVFLKDIPERVILLSDCLEVPAIDNLWNYLSHFYEIVPSALKQQFAFEDLAGIYTEKGLSRLFALCIRYTDISGLKRLPGGTYLCANCTEKNREGILEELLSRARAEYKATPPFAVQLVVVSGILQWNYEVQVLLKEDPGESPT